MRLLQMLPTMRVPLSTLAAVSSFYVLLAPTVAVATEGYFQNGYGARSKALAGAGAADSRDATAASLNPAGIVHADDELDIAASFFMPFREMVGSGPPGFTPTGDVDSRLNFFAMPNIARNWKVQGNPWLDAFALTVYGNGGMNTTYPTVARPDGGCGPGAGVFCFGKMGVDLKQLMFSAAMAKRFGSVSVGIAPIFAVQLIKLQGLDAFTAASLSPTNVTGNDVDPAYGGGVRGGIEWAVTRGFRLGLTGTTPIWMTKFENYRGLFAEGGGFDIPASVQAGIAVDIAPNFTVMADYRRIFYGSVDSIANPSTNIFNCAVDPSFCLGGSNGPGFGWSDINVIKIGAEWRQAMPGLTLRAGYSWNENPIKPRDVMFNIIAPGVVQHHITGGLQYKLTESVDFEAAVMYAPYNSVSGFELPGFGNPAHGVKIGMSQFEGTIGFKYRFGEAAPASYK